MRKTTLYSGNQRGDARRDAPRPQRLLIGEDIGYYGGLFRVTRNLMDEFGPNRVIDTPISEQGFVGMAVGSAMVGLRPIIELMYMDFFLVCADQIFNQAAKMHYMTGGLLHVPMVIRGQHGGGKRYGSQHSQAWRAPLPSSPASRSWRLHALRRQGLLISAIRDDNPVLFLEHKMLYFTRGDMPEADEEYTVPIGKADVKREGSDLTLVPPSATRCCRRWKPPKNSRRARHRHRGGGPAQHRAAGHGDGAHVGGQDGAAAGRTRVAVQLRHRRRDRGARL
jgi:pyruvate/2-oxoglutarate/acetoin dehydrogenase E1 component